MSPATSTGAWNDVEIHDQLMQFAWRYRDNPTLFTSFRRDFRGAGTTSMKHVSSSTLWDRIQSLTEKDSWRGQTPDPRVSADPADPHFFP